jgi:hypothetical protein
MILFAASMVLIAGCLFTCGRYLLSVIDDD